MKLPRVPSPSTIRRDYDLRARTGIGQHFLARNEILQKIAHAAKIRADESTVIEIGMGPGYLTAHLIAEEPRRLIALEMERRFSNLIDSVFGEFSNMCVEYGDALKQDFAALVRADGAETERDLVIVGNIPYQITSPLLFKIWECGLPWRRAVLMVQKEMAERLTAERGTGDHGILTLKGRYFAETDILFDVGRRAFDPPPRVDSAVIVMTPREDQPYDETTRQRFFTLINGAFAQKRKTIVNSLCGSPPFPIEKEQLLAALERCGIDPQARAQTLTLDDFQRLFAALMD
ncbi:ribosomal RNA small subunit methyltransferase A [Candidatus Sumerlaeota bacterium]|nr:ribosomal RNA small subunit methyltransferase A [Candidatus Sumerlaeota bacterium]